MLTRTDLKDIAEGLSVAAASFEGTAREVGEEHSSFEYLVARAARFRRLRARTLRETREAR